MPKLTDRRKTLNVLQMKILVQILFLALLCCKTVMSLKKIDIRKRNNLAVIRDVTESCTSQLETSIFLPPVGISSSVVLKISTNYLKNQNTNCKILITTEIELKGYQSGSFNNTQLGVTSHNFKRSSDGSNVYMILVIEFFAYNNITNADLNFCNTLKGRIILRGDSKIIDVCHQLTSFSKISAGIFRAIFLLPEVRIDVQLFMIGTLKVTATTARPLKINDMCNTKTEVNCRVFYKHLCVDSSVLCDGNINCGYYNRYDEDPKECDPTSDTWVIGVYIMVLIIIALVLLVQLLRFYIPKVSDNLFIFKENEDNKLILNSQMQRPLDRDGYSITTVQDLEFLNKININKTLNPTTVGPNNLDTQVEYPLNNVEIELKSLIYDKQTLA